MTGFGNRGGRNKLLFIPSNGDGNTKTNYWDGQAVAANADGGMESIMPLPLDFVALVSVKALVVAYGTGNIRWKTNSEFGAEGEDYNAQTDTIAYNDTAIVANKLTLIDITATFTGLAKGDYVGLFFYRVGTHANDTVDAAVNLIGFELIYKSNSP